MSVLKIKDQNGNWQDIPAIKGADGAIQYKAGTNIQINNNTISTSGLNQTQVQDLIDASIEALGELGFTPTVVEELPSEDIDTHTIYLVPKQDSEQEDAYDEWLYINNAWEHIGSTSVDLSNYYTKSEIENKVIEIDVSISTNSYWLEKGQDIVNSQFGNSSYIIKTTDGDIVNIGTLKTNKIILVAYVPSAEQLTETGIIYGVKYTTEKVWRITINFDADTKIVSSVSRNQFNRNISEATSMDQQPLTTGNTSAYTPTGNYNPATKKYVDDAVANVPTPDMSDYYTKSEIDNKISYTLTLETQPSYNANYDISTNISSTDKTAVLSMIKTLYERGENYPLINISILSNANASSSMIAMPNQSFQRFATGNSIDLYCYTFLPNLNQYAKTTLYIVVNRNDSSNIDDWTILSAYWAGTEFIVSNKQLPNYVLTKTNTTSYTPTANYHPATKKYVDDAIASAITDALGGSY